MDSIKKMKKVVLILVATVAITSTSIPILNELYIDSKQKKFDNVKELMMKNSSDRCLSLDVSNPIGVLVQELNENEKQEVKKTIEQMNKISPNLEYVLCETKDITLKNYIHVMSVDNLQNEFDNSYGLAIFTHDEKSATIQFPINIYINEKVNDIYDYENDVSAFSYVLKHELMHTLGFKDLYDEKYFNKTIMYHEFDMSTKLYDFSESDIANIREIYGDSGEEVLIEKTESSEPVKIDYIKKREDYDYEL